MQHDTSTRVGRLSTFVILATVVFAFAFQPALVGGAKGKGKKKGGGGDATASAENPHADVIGLGFKFDGANACSNTDCHGAAEPKAGKQRNGAEFNLWNAKDDHKTGYKSLEGKEGKKIAKASKIKSAAKSERCLSCHAVQVPAELEGSEFKLKEGVTCAACHGPSEKWLEPHAKEGWTAEQRAGAESHEALLKEWGLYDTKNPLARANKCTSCHLAMDADLIAAGHPQPKFELDFYSRSDASGGIYTSRHWSDPDTAYYSVRLWATGQAVALRDAMKQLVSRAAGGDAEATTAAYQQAMGHFRMVSALVEAGVVKADADAWATNEKNLAAAVEGGAMAEVGEAASALRDEADALVPQVGAFEPDADTTLALLKAVAAVEGMSDLGDRGMEQQAYAIYSLYTAHANEGQPVTKDDKVGQMIAKSILPPRKTGKKEPKAMTADQFNKGLEAVRKALPA